MEFIPQREFFHPHVNTKMKRKSTADNVKPQLLTSIGLHLLLRLRAGRVVPVRGPLEREALLLEKEKHGAEVSGRQGQGPRVG